MAVPGANILNMALRVIARQPFRWFPFAYRLTQPNGQYLSAYSAPVDVSGSVQAVPRSLYQQDGLDFEKNYLNFFASSDLIDVQRDVSGDLLTFAGNTYQCISSAPWYAMDGWVQMLAVQIQNIPQIVGMSGPAPGNYATGDVLTFTVSFNSPVAVVGSPYFQLAALSGFVGGIPAELGTESNNPIGTQGGSTILADTNPPNAVYAPDLSTPTSLAFLYTVQEGDTAAGLTETAPIYGKIANPDGVPANPAFVPVQFPDVTLNAA